MAKFRIEVTLRCPGIFDGLNTLESLLSAAIHEQTGLQRENALALVPLEKVGDLWQCSALYYEGFYGNGEEAIIRHRRRSETGADFYEARQRRSKFGQWHVDQKTGDYKTLFNLYKTTLCRRLVWFASGDADKCQRLLYSLQAIGKRRKQGYGEIEDVMTFPTDESPVVDARGMVRRPIPLQHLASVPGALASEKQTLELVAWRHPFWDGERTVCAVPDSQYLDFVMKASGIHPAQPKDFFA